MIGVLSNPAYFLTPLIVATVTLFLLIIAAIWSRRDFSSVLFCGILASLVLWNLFVFGVRSSPDVRHALAWARAEIVPAVAVFVLYYHFTLIHTNTRRQRRILLASYLFLAVAVVLAPTDLIFKAVTIEDYGYNLIMGQASYFLLPVAPLLILGGASNLLRYYKVSPSYEERNRLIYLVVAAAFSLIGALLDGFTNLPPALIWGNLIFSVLCTVAIVKYHLLDIRIVFRKSLVYLLVSVMVAIPYVGILVLINEVFKSELRVWWIYALMILLLAIILRPLYGWAQNLVDRLFYRDRYNYLRALEHFSRETRSIVKTDEMASTLVKLVSGALRSSNTCLLLPSDDNSGLAVVACVGLDNPPSGTVLRNENLLVKWLKLHRDILPYEDFNVIPQLQSLSLSEKSNIERMGARLFVPIKTLQGKLSGMLILGQKLSQQSYSNEDKELLKALSSQMAMVLENARLYDDALRARENLEKWLDGMTDCVMIVNTVHTIQFMNRAAIEKLGSRVGEQCWVATGKVEMCPSCPIQEYSHGSSDGLHYSESIRDRDYDIAIAPLLNPDGSLSVIEVLRDITGRRQVEEERQRIERLESLGTLAGGIAHDFNNLLTGIMGNIGLAKRYVESKSKAEERLLEAERASLRAKDLTQQLLTFARGGAPIKKLVSITELIEDSASFALRGSNVRCDFSLQDDLWSAEVDEGQINQVITNLVINADEAMPEGGILNIGAKNSVVKPRSILPLPEGHYVEIAIEDHGVGISKEHLRKIFDPYFTTKQKGSGLGLVTVYSIIKNHGGYITVKSKLGVGTTFQIYLPASEKLIPAKKEEVAETTVAGKGRVLVMDDEEIIRALLHLELTDIGYEVELTVDGAQAIEQYANAKESGKPFDAVILDLTVPGGMGGKDVIKKMLEIDPSVKAIVSSGYSTDPIMSDFVEYGFSGVVAKPYKIEQLEKALHSILVGTSE